MPPVHSSKGQLEAEITKTIIQFEREQLGRGPHEARTWIVQDMILVRLKGVLTPAEEKLAQDEDGKNLIKQLRMQLIEHSRAVLEKMIQEITGVPIVSLHSDISTKTGERVIILTMAENLQTRFRGQRTER
jgi:uncharacterized protein YbcI